MKELNRPYFFVSYGRKSVIHHGTEKSEPDFYLWITIHVHGENIFQHENSESSICCKILNVPTSIFAVAKVLAFFLFRSILYSTLQKLSQYVELLGEKSHKSAISEQYLIYVEATREGYILE